MINIILTVHIHVTTGVPLYTFYWLSVALSEDDKKVPFIEEKFIHHFYMGTFTSM